ncbi:MAG: Pilus assembly protein PilP [Rickettsiaceae bacterium]|jgi:Tfp pilus assembly protein PilP|nr:Pilus assembly protein PilP [Rickettsiaceae bacterium]
MRNKLLTLCASIAILPAIAAAEGPERDPFTPYALSKPALASAKQETAGEKGVSITPLTEDPLSSYKLTGLIISPRESIVLIQAHDKHEYFATAGDKLGSEGGVIHLVSTEGITVDVGGKLVDLTVNNNRFDIQNEAN